MGDGRRNDLFALFLMDVTISHLRRHGYERTNGPNKLCLFSPPLSLSICCLSARWRGRWLAGANQEESVQLTIDSINCIPSGGYREYKLATWNRLFCPRSGRDRGRDPCGKSRPKWSPIATRPLYDPRVSYVSIWLSVLGNEIRNEREYENSTEELLVENLFLVR